VAGRTVAAPPPPVNKMPVYGNSAVGIPADSERFIRSIVRAAIKEYFTSCHTLGYQTRQDIEQAVSYVELHEPLRRACVRSCGACALLSRAINNKASYARCCCDAAPESATPSRSAGSAVAGASAGEPGIGSLPVGADRGAVGSGVPVGAGARAREGGAAGGMAAADTVAGGYAVVGATRRGGAGTTEARSEANTATAMDNFSSIR